MNPTPIGHVTPDTAFGKMLTTLAGESEVILETGGFYGLGTTRCLHAGLKRDSQRLHSLDYDAGPQTHARTLYADDPRVVFITGTIVKPEEFQEFIHPDPAITRQIYYDPERAHNATAPYVLDQIPEDIDLLVLDGGEWTSDVEFQKLYERAKVIALDDALKLKSNKNWRAHWFLIGEDWELIAENWDERNGWSVFRRPEQSGSNEQGNVIV